MKPLHYTPSGIESYNNQITNHTPVNIIRSETIRGGVNIALIASFREYIKVNGYPEPRRYTEQKKKIRLHSTYPVMKIYVTDYNEDSSPVEVTVELSPNFDEHRITSFDIVKIKRGREVYHTLEDLEVDHSDWIVREIEKEMEREMDEFNRR